MKLVSIILLTVAFNAFILESAQTAKKQIFLAILTLDLCEGRYSGNYTIIETAVGVSGNCQVTLEVSPITQIIQYGPKGERNFSSALRLAASNYPNGATYYYIHLNLVISGPLQGTYILLKQEYIRGEYNKKCSSGLGKGVTYNPNIELVIIDKIDLSILISNNPYESSKNGSSTICRGYKYVV